MSSPRTVIVDRPAVVFNDEERARAREMLEWAAANVQATDERVTVANSGGLFAGIRTAYSLAMREGVRWRILTFSIRGLAQPPAAACKTIAIDLFEFDWARRVVGVVDPGDPSIIGLAQPLERDV